jgi:2-polyprenyl-3-methyl-5-hydroxy-6-metoxy-1,4-benzoquinol methylase
MTSSEEVRLQGLHCSLLIRRPAPALVLLKIDGADVGELGERPFQELEKDLARVGTLQLFVDARTATGPSIDVSGRWAAWFNSHRLRFEHVTMLTGSRLLRMTAGLVRDFSGLGDRMRIYKDAAAFDEVLRAATMTAFVARGPRGFPNWEDLYRNDTVEKLPWYFPSLDPDLGSALERHGIRKGRVLDLGTGPGTQAIALAEQGFAVTATDVSSAAIAYAAELAKAKGVAVQFATDDVLAAQIAGPFDAIFDRGCFHVIAPEERPTYVATVHRLLAPSGWLFLKTFSHHQPGTQGPHRFTPEAIRELFADDRGFEVVEMMDTVYQGQLDPFPKALFTALRQRALPSQKGK